MSPDALLRMNVYQEGQRAYRSGAHCPYTDWRAKTWAKGRAAAEEYFSTLVRQEESKPESTPCPCCGRSDSYQLRSES